MHTESPEVVTWNLKSDSLAMEIPYGETDDFQISCSYLGGLEFVHFSDSKRYQFFTNLSLQVQRHSAGLHLCPFRPLVPVGILEGSRYEKLMQTEACL